jgi:hypothetical protein
VDVGPQVVEAGLHQPRPGRRLRVRLAGEALPRQGLARLRQLLLLLLQFPFEGGGLAPLELRRAEDDQPVGVAVDLRLLLRRQVARGLRPGGHPAHRGPLAGPRPFLDQPRGGVGLGQARDEPQAGGPRRRQVGRGHEGAVGHVDEFAALLQAEGLDDLRDHVGVQGLVGGVAVMDLAPQREALPAAQHR